MRRLLFATQIFSTSLIMIVIPKMINILCLNILQIAVYFKEIGLLNMILGYLTKRDHFKYQRNKLIRVSAQIFLILVLVNELLNGHFWFDVAFNLNKQAYRFTNGKLDTETNFYEVIDRRFKIVNALQTSLIILWMYSSMATIKSSSHSKHIKIIVVYRQQVLKSQGTFQFNSVQYISSL